MKKPKIWWFNGKWWCGRYQGVILKIPVADILGSGKSPSEAYSKWVICKWGVGRIIAGKRRKSRAMASKPITPAAIPPKSKWLRFLYG